MKINRLTYLIFVLIGLQSVAMAQVDSTRIDTVIIDTTALRIISLPEDASEEEEEEPLFKVTPWEFHAPLGATLAATDSTLRWQNWPDWTYKLNVEPGIISYRMGTSIRTNAVQRDAHEPRHQELYWEGISLNDPVSGALHWSLIPQHKIGEFYEKDLGIKHRSVYYLRQYYLNRPLSRLIYSESKFQYENMEFEVSHNLSQKTNVALSYWDRSVGGEYANSEISGRQIYGKISHHIDHRRYLKLNYFNNKYDIDRPFGYVIPNLSTYNFDRYTTAANQPSARSAELSSLLALNFYQRSPDTTLATDDFRAGLFYRGVRRRLDYSADSSRYKVQSVGVNSKKWWKWGGLKLEGSAGAEHFFNLLGKSRSLQTSDWTLFKAEGAVVLDFIPVVELRGGGGVHYRSDGFQTYRLNATSEFELGGLTLTPGTSIGSMMPTPQQLYWRSLDYKGNSDLVNEKVQEARVSLSYNFTPDTYIGIRGQHKEVSDGIFLEDTSFTNVSNYASQSATAFFQWDLPHFEFNGSATVHRFTDSYTSPVGSIPMSGRKKVWLKGGAYWKGYLFDRATYVKAGVSGMLAPFRYQADHYYPVLDYWQSVSEDQQLPVFDNLDVSISARVRSIMFVLRWENVLDDVSQLGYFETAQYPMSQRRFIFGVRAYFRN